MGPMIPPATPLREREITGRRDADRYRSVEPSGGVASRAVARSTGASPASFQTAFIEAVDPVQGLGVRGRISRLALPLGVGRLQLVEEAAEGLVLVHVALGRPRGHPHRRPGRGPIAG